MPSSIKVLHNLFFVVDAPSFDGATALFCAAFGCHVVIVEGILDSFADKENEDVKLDQPAFGKRFVAEEISVQRTVTKDVGRIAGLEVLKLSWYGKDEQTILSYT
ncbi:hypothetical protein SUGI_0554090 [Cryptomeria japonica]|nr:hypothetical protein SUGI_0554090 [Cryptomeria japonica]